MCKQPIWFLSDVAGGMSGVATMHPQPAPPPCLGSAHRGSSVERGSNGNRWSNGLGSRRPLTRSGAAGAREGTWHSRALPSPRAAGGHRCSAGPNGHDVAPTPAAEGWPSYSRGPESPPRTRPRSLHPRAQHPHPHLAPTCSVWRVAKERGAAQEPPPWGQEQ